MTTSLEIQYKTKLIHIKYQMLIDTLKGEGWIVHLTTFVVGAGGDVYTTSSMPLNI